MIERIEFEWDEDNIGHIALHDVVREEVEFVLLNDPLELAVTIRSGEQRVVCAGFTSAGKALQVVYTLRENRVRVVTAHPAHRKVRKML